MNLTERKQKHRKDILDLFLHIMLLFPLDFPSKYCFSNLITSIMCITLICIQIWKCVFSILAFYPPCLYSWEVYASYLLLSCSWTCGSVACKGRSLAGWKQHLWLLGRFPKVLLRAEKWWNFLDIHWEKLIKWTNIILKYISSINHS